MKLKVLMMGIMVMSLVNVSMIVAAEDLNESKGEIKSEDTTKVCPICGPEEGMTGKDDFSYEYQGRTYYFCSQDCLNIFQENPEKFSKKMEEDMDTESHEGHDHKDHSDRKDHDGHDHK